MRLWAEALAYVLLVWGCSCVVVLVAYLFVSLDDFRKVLAAAASGSAPAMWFAPAMLLLSGRTLASAAAGVILVANTVRLLMSREAPKTVALENPTASRRSAPRLFRSATGPELPRETLAPILGGFAIQIGIVAMVAGYPILSAAFVAGAAAVWTKSSLRRGAYRPRPQAGRGRTVINVALTLLLTVSVSLAFLSSNERLTKHQPLERAKRAWTRLAAGGGSTAESKTKPGSRSINPAKAIILTGLVPGVILRPPTKLAQQPRLVLRGPQAVLPWSSPVEFQFTGEYQLFPASSGGVGDDAAIDRGTPLDAVYRTVTGSPLKTVAYQKLTPPIDFRNCAKVELTVLSNEAMPGVVAMQILAAGGVQNLGSDIFGLRPGGEEMLEFAVPALSQSWMADGIRVEFHGDPRRNYLSAQVAVRSVRLVPRGGR